MFNLNEPGKHNKKNSSMKIFISLFVAMICGAGCTTSTKIKTVSGAGDKSVIKLAPVKKASARKAVKTQIVGKTLTVVVEFINPTKVLARDASGNLLEVVIPRVVSETLVQGQKIKVMARVEVTGTKGAFSSLKYGVRPVFVGVGSQEDELDYVPSTPSEFTDFILAP